MTFDYDYDFQKKLEQDRLRNQGVIERAEIAGQQRERLKEIDRETKIFLDDRQWERKPEEMALQHQALLQRLTAELQYIEHELSIRRDDLVITNLLTQIDNELSHRRTLIEQGWSLLMQRLFKPGTAPDEGISPEELELDLQLQASQLIRK